MPMTRTYCPRCRQPISANLEQLFDVNQDPKAKQRIMSGAFNIAKCPSCGYEGMIATPIVYHDADKELLLTYCPPELGLPFNEQERMMGPMITSVTSRLPQEKRKAYLLRPQTMLTMQGLVEKVLEADGITREMMQASQARLTLLQRLLTAAADSRAAIIQQEEKAIDESFFGMLNSLIQVSLSQGDQNSARQLAELQKMLLESTESGRKLKLQAAEAETVLTALKEASKDGLTREKLLNLVINTTSDVGINTLVSLARTGMDYDFFAMLSMKIDASPEPEKTRLSALREKLLAMTQEMDAAVRKQVEGTQKALEAILSAPNLEEALQQNQDDLNELFIEMVDNELAAARQKGDFARSAKLMEIKRLLQPPELTLINELVSAGDEDTRQKVLQANAAMVNQQFLELLSNIMTQNDQPGQSPEVIERLRAVHRSALRFSMAKNIKG
jgi:hypothetical protein